MSEWLRVGHEMNVSMAVKACGDRRFREVNKWTKKLNMLGCADPVAPPNFHSTEQIFRDPICLSAHNQRDKQALVAAEPRRLTSTPDFATLAT